MKLCTLAATRAPVFGLALLFGLAGCGGEGSGTAGSHYIQPAPGDPDLTQVCGASSGGAVQGYDVSVYQGAFSWAAPGISFGAARISDGSGYIDPEFDHNWSTLKARGLIRAAYQFFEPGEDEVAQANLVIQKVGKLGAGDLPVMLDVEVTGGQSAATIRARSLHWLQLVEAGTGKRPFVYSYASFLESYLGSGFGSYPLWIANYGASCPSVPAGWSNWVFWQYSDGGGALDHDVFNGSEAQLKALAGVVLPPTPKPVAPTHCGAIDAGHGLWSGEEVSSCDGRFTLAMQTDGNLVLYLNGSTGALWESGTGGSDGTAAVMQSDGNFVLYGRTSNAIWSSNTGGHGGAALAVQSDGNLVVYQGATALWNTGTSVMGAPAKPGGCGAALPGEGLAAGESLSSCDGRFTLAMQSDGNLVLYKNGVGALWNTGSEGKLGYVAVMQSDGNFVLYDRHAKPLWFSRTYGHPGARLEVQTDGNLVVYSGNTPIWASHTNGK